MGGHRCHCAATHTPVTRPSHREELTRSIVMNLQVTIAHGLTFSSVYALSALGFAILYNTTGCYRHRLRRIRGSRVHDRP